MGGGVADGDEGEEPIGVPAAAGEGAMPGPAAESTLVIAGTGPAGGGGVALGQGSFRTALGMSGRGASSAIRTSISRLLLSPALARTDWWFSAVRCFPSRRT